MHSLHAAQEMAQRVAAVIHATGASAEGVDDSFRRWIIKHEHGAKPRIELAGDAERLISGVSAIAHLRTDEHNVGPVLECGEQEVTLRHTSHQLETARARECR